jgi:hypothetical protein
MIIKILLATIGIALCTALALASPTSDDYRKCHRVAAATLTDCLDQTPGQASTQCWATSERSNRNCYRSVQQDHQPNAVRRAAAQKAEEAARR